MTTQSAQLEGIGFEEFMIELTAPLYTWRMAWGLIAATPPRPEGTKLSPQLKSAITRMTNAEKKIDDLVLKRAAAIMEERNGVTT